MFKILLALVLLVFSFDASSAIMPWNLLWKTYAGIGISNIRDTEKLPSGSNKSGFSSAASNFNIHTGVRVLRFFGVEAGYQRNNMNFRGDGLNPALLSSQNIRMQGNFAMNMSQFYLDAMLFLPIINLHIVSLDLYGSLGTSQLTIANNYGSGFDSSGVGRRAGLGFEIGFWSKLAVRAGIDRVSSSSISETIGVGSINSTKIGLSWYF